MTGDGTKCVWGLVLMLFSLGENSKCKNLSPRKKRLEDSGYGYTWRIWQMNKNYKETVKS